MHYQDRAVLLQQEEVAPRHFRMRLSAAAIAIRAQAGQFIHLLPRVTPSVDPLLRRAFSILKVDGDAVEILYRVEGRGTAAMAHLVVGEKVDILGPLGTPFTLLERPTLLVGGGVGVPPMSMLASTYTGQSRSDPSATRPEVTALIGARSSAELICLDDFEEYGVPFRIATDDGSAGYHGRVTDLLEEALQEHDTDNPPHICACGPLPMLHAVAVICARYHVPCQISLEENMPCGVGVCNGCVIPMKSAPTEYDCFRRICVQGPVVWAHDVDWSYYETRAHA